MEDGRRSRGDELAAWTAAVRTGLAGVAMVWKHSGERRSARDWGEGTSMVNAAEETFPEHDMAHEESSSIPAGQQQLVSDASAVAPWLGQPVS